ncbi:hypothetical protein MASR2M50_23350 [Thauera sp.]
MIEPPPPSFISATPALQPRKTLSALTRIRRCQSSSEASSIEPLTRMPALFTRMSRRPKRARTRRHHRVPVGRRGGVLADERRLAAEACRQRLAGVRVEVGEHDLGAFADEQLHRRAADAARAPGDQRHLAFDPSCHVLGLLSVRHASAAMWWAAM